MFKLSAIIFVALLSLMIQVPCEAADKCNSVPGYANAEIGKLKQDIEKTVSGKTATAGVSIETDECEVLTINRGKRFPLMSVFKFHIALAVLDKLDKNDIPLDTPVLMKKTELSHDTYSPLIKKFPDQDLNISIGELVRYSVSHSDNNACDYLIGYVGGISRVEEYVRGLGIKGFRLAVAEREMHDDIMRQYANWSTPESAVSLMRTFLEKPLFSGQYKDFLIQAMVDSSTGKNKLKAMLPPETVVGHKTGSSNRTGAGVQIAENDIAFIYLPNGKRYYISVFIRDSKETDEANIDMIARVSKVTYDFFLKNDGLN